MSSVYTDAAQLGRLPTADRLRALRRIIPRARVEAVLRRTGHAGHRYLRLPAWFMVWFVIALGLALEKLVEAGTLTSVPLKDFVAAVSVGIVDGEILLDLCYEEDSRADVDMNFVMTAGHKMVEIQATAEHQVFDEHQLNKMLAFARQGVQSLIAKQQAVLSKLTLRQ